MITTYTFWGVVGLLIEMFLSPPLTHEAITVESYPKAVDFPVDYYLDIESITQKAYRVNDPGNDSELYFVYGSVLTDRAAVSHASWSFSRNPYIQLSPFQTSKRRVPIIAHQILQPLEYIVVNIGIMDEDCESTNRGQLSNLFIPDLSAAPRYRPGYVGGLTPSWSGLMVGRPRIPQNDIRKQIPPPFIDLGRIKQITEGQCSFRRADDLQGYISIIAWNNPYASPGSRMWDYYCDPAMCHAPPQPTGDSLIVHTRYDNAHDITFKVTMRTY